MIKKNSGMLILASIFFVVFAFFLLNSSAGEFFYRTLMLKSKNFRNSVFQDVDRASTLKLVSIINQSKNNHLYAQGSWWNTYRLNRHIASITALASKKDDLAKKEIERVFDEGNEDDKCDIIDAIGKHKNEAMTNFLCRVLIRHISWRTDQIAIHSLIALDDSSALSVLKTERGKIKREYSRFLADQAIKRWEIKKLHEYE